MLSQPPCACRVGLSVLAVRACAVIAWSCRHYILEFKKRGLRYLPRMTKTAQSTTYIHRNYDLFGNMVVFAAMGENDIRDTDAVRAARAARTARWGRYV